MDDFEHHFKKPDPGWRSTFSMIIGIGWLIFIIAWLAFSASDYAWEKNLAIILLSILVIFVLLGGIWTIWGMKMIPREGKTMFKMFGFKWRLQLSIIIPLASLVFLIIWFWFYATPFTIWQNIAVILITLLIIGGILGSIWTRWGMKNSWKFENKTDAAYYHHGRKEDENDKQDKN